MKLCLLGTIAICFSTIASADPVLHCRAADEGNHNPERVTVTESVGAESVDPVVSEYGDYEITVQHTKRDEIRGYQSFLLISANDFTAGVHNISTQSRYELRAPGLFVQCWFERTRLGDDD